MADIEPKDLEGETKARLGRPPLPADQARSERIVTFVTPSELDALKERAEDEGASLSSVVYRAIAKDLEDR